MVWYKRDKKEQPSNTRADLERQIGAPEVVPFITQFATYCRTVELIKPVETTPTYREAFQQEEDITKWSSREVTIHQDEKGERIFSFSELKTDQNFIEAIFTLSAFERMADESFYQYQRTKQKQTDLNDTHYIKVAESEGLVFSTTGRPHITNKFANLPASNGRFYERDLDRAEAHRKAAQKQGPNVNQPQFLSDVFAQASYRGNFELSLRNATKLAVFYKLPTKLRTLDKTIRELDRQQDYIITNDYAANKDIDAFWRAQEECKTNLKLLLATKVVEDIQPALDFVDLITVQTLTLYAQTMFRLLNKSELMSKADHHAIKNATGRLTNVKNKILEVCQNHHILGSQDSSKLDEMIVNGSPLNPQKSLKRVIKRLDKFVQNVQNLQGGATNPPHISFEELFNPKQSKIEKSEEIKIQHAKKTVDALPSQAHENRSFLKNLIRSINS